MPFRRNYKRKRFGGISRKRRRFTRRRFRPRIPRVQLGSISRQKTEIKCMDMSFTASGWPYTVDQTLPQDVLYMSDIVGNNHQCLNLVRQGTGVSQRIGNKIAMKSLRIKLGMAIRADTFVATPLTGRIIILYDKQPNGQYIDLNQIIGTQSTNNTEHTSAQQRTFGNIFPKLFDRYIVIMDKQLTLPPRVGIVAGDPLQTLSSTEKKDYFIDEYIKLNKLETQFTNTIIDGGVNNISTVMSGALIMYWTSDGLNVASAPTHLYSGCTRLRYYDT